MPVLSTARNQFLDFAKGMLILVVTWGHVIQYVGYNNASFWDDPIFKAIYTFHMPLFMALSGFLSFNSIQRTSFKTLAAKRLANLILPILSWTILFDVGFVLAHHATAPIPFLQQLVTDFIDALWFLWSLYWSIITVAILRMIRFDTIAGFLTASAFSLALPETHNLWMFKYVFPFFCVGYEVARRKDLLSRLNTRWTIALVGCATLIWFFCWRRWSVITYIYLSRMTVHRWNLPNIFLRDIAAITGSFVFLASISVLFKATRSPFIARLGRGSLYIYILQIYLIQLIGRYEYPSVARGRVVGLAIALIISVALLLVGEIAENIPGDPPSIFWSSYLELSKPQSSSIHRPGPTRQKLIARHGRIHQHRIRINSPRHRMNLRKPMLPQNRGPMERPRAMVAIHDHPPRLVRRQFLHPRLQFMQRYPRRPRNPRLIPFVLPPNIHKQHVPTLLRRGNLCGVNFPGGVYLSHDRLR